ncbi:MAG TPA: iron ABC transporter permease [Acidimicrobiia bacterium]|nr:iron ABC transporter permease [Acidimicrobiia bacterium]
MVTLAPDVSRAGDPSGSPPEVGGRERRAPVALVVAGLAIAVLFTAPLGYLIQRNADDVSGLVATITSAAALEPLGRTIWLAATVTIACATLGTGLAWLVTRTDLPGRRVFAVLAALPLVLPSFVAAVALVSVLSSGGLLQDAFGLDTGLRVRGYWAAFGVLTLISYPYVYLPVAARLSGLPPSLEESARALGRRPTAVFRTVVWPQTVGAVAAGSLLVFLYVVSEFGAVSILRYDTLTRRIYAARLLDPQAAIAMSLLLATIAIAIVVGERGVNRRRSRVEISAVGARPHQTPLGRWKIPSVAGVTTVVSLAIGAPVVVLSWWTIRGLTGGRSVLGRDADISSLVSPTLNTAGLAVSAAVVAVAVVLPIAYLTTRYRSSAGGVADTLIVGGFALPGIVIALALVAWTLNAPFIGRLYQTLPLLVFAYVVHFGAQAMRASEVAVAGVPRRLDDAARSLGAGRWRRFRTVEGPLMVPGLAAGAGLVLLSVMKELPTTLLLAPIGVDTLALRIWSATQEGFFAQAGLAALVLVALSAVLTWFLTIGRLDRLGR